MESQKQKILNLLLDNEWSCTSAMYALYMSDPRRRIVDLKKDGYILESRKCESHDYHRGGSKEWRLISLPNHKTEAPIPNTIKLHQGYIDMVQRDLMAPSIYELALGIGEGKEEIK